MITPSRWPIAGFYACYFAVIGVWIPYWPLYLTNLGYGAETIGLLTALTQWIRIPGPPLWGRLADRTSRHTVIIFSCFAAFAAFCLFFFGSGLLWVVMATILYSIFHTGPLSLTDATAMELSSQRHWDYGKLRLWGSWGFILFSLGVGPLTDWGGMGFVPITIALLLLGNAFFTLWLPRSNPVVKSETPVPHLFARPDTRWFYGSALLMQFSHGGYYGFMSLHLQHQGYSLTAIGLLWAIGVFAEVGLMILSGRLLARFGVLRMLTFSLLMAALRWSLYSITIELSVLIVAQLLHAFTFAAFHIASVRRVHEIASIQERATAQGWLAALSYGAGGGLGMAISGLLFNRMGYEAMFFLMSLAALFGVMASHRAMILFQRQEHLHV
ncbi:MAG: MFS transporter [Magnetococcales bacterium]|nr:MFS transporter [Magnetococcales bacterium]MBF0439085.1 MFS transporter [Magnetococcales bacterium]